MICEHCSETEMEWQGRDTANQLFLDEEHGQIWASFWSPLAWSLCQHTTTASVCVCMWMCVCVCACFVARYGSWKADISYSLINATHAPLLDFIKQTVLLTNIILTVVKSDFVSRDSLVDLNLLYLSKYKSSYFVFHFWKDQCWALVKTFDQRIQLIKCDILTNLLLT